MRVNSLKHDSPDYPPLLARLHTPPGQLFWLGTHPNELTWQPRVAIVGSRKVTGYGRQVTQQLAGELAKEGIVIISGLALGVDSIAHQAAIDAGGLTIAVLPTGLDQIYPPSHLNLARQIVETGGCLISEYPADTEAYPANFIARNRIVSGFADALLITEAARNSGTMHTAGFALEQGKTVMAVPGNINNPMSEGCNNLIKNGATPVTSVEDVLQALNIKPSKRIDRIFRGSTNEQLLFDLIKQGICNQDELAAAAKLDMPTLSGTLTMLEINGYIRADAGNWTLA
ncbi:DNA-protecting protein DprA [Candidatus Saccharibacteria bacterium]|nr:DNA-protecting protein DprA [Candidatus Saccharibacteria bacterium]